MSTFFEYMLKISLCFGIIYLFYFVLLKRLTLYSTNRFFLLVSSVFVFFIPLISVDLFITPQKINAFSLINQVPSLNISTAKRIFIPGESSGDIGYILMGLFVSGVVIELVRLFIQLRSFKKISYAAQFIGETEGIRLYHLDRNIIPFSFGKAVYLNKLLHSEEELAEIIKHESVHVQQKHTIDVMIAEFVCILNWYNPFVWLIKHAIRQNLEFLADDIVIKKGTDKKNYQYLLLKVTGHSPFAITSNLKFSSLKQRIYMMNKAKTSKKHLWKFLFVLPVITLVILAFRDTDGQRLSAVKHDSYVKEETFKLSELSWSIDNADVALILRREQDKSLLQVGKPFTITIIKNERDRLKELLERNGYHNITNRTISFLIDSSLTNNSFSVQVNISLSAKAISISDRNKTRDKKSNAFSDKENKNEFHLMVSWNNNMTQSVASYITGYPSHISNVNGADFFNIYKHSFDKTVTS